MTVNGQRVCELPVLVDPEHDVIRVDRRRIEASRKIYYLLHKPTGVLCTASDPAGRKRAIDLLRGVRERVYPVGRLDADSDGLLLMTNDGELANQLTHPRYGTPKTYRVEIEGTISATGVDKLRNGIWLDDGRTQPARIKIVHRGRVRSVIEITLREGRNRQVRRMLARLGHRVRKLTRVKIGRITLHGLGVGRFRPLTTAELDHLKRLSRNEAGPTRQTRRPGKPLKKFTKKKKKSRSRRVNLPGGPARA